MNEIPQPENILDIYNLAWQTMSSDAHCLVMEILGVGYIEHKNFEAQTRTDPITRQTYQISKAIEELEAIQVLEQTHREDNARLIYILIEDFKDFAVKKIFFPTLS